MEITEINMLSEFEAGMKCLQNPSLLSHFSPLPQLYSFCKWGALFLAFFATFTSLIHRIKLLTLTRIKSFVISPSRPLFTKLLSAADYDQDFDFSDDDDISSSGSVSDDSDEELEFEWPEDRNQNDEDFRFAGANNCFTHYRGQNNGNFALRRFSLSDFSAGKSVVKLWDSFGFGLDFEENDDDVGEAPVWDFDSSSFPSGSISSSPAVFLSSEVNDDNGVVLGAYDTRMGGEGPAIYAEWRPRRGKNAYVGDGVNGGALTVGDLRNVRTPLE